MSERKRCCPSIVQTLQHVASSEATSEKVGAFCNAQIVIPMRFTLEAIVHQQLPTPIKTYNSTTVAFVHNNANQKRPKPWDMRHHWLRDNETMNQTELHWKKGTSNNADYFTKHHPKTHHRDVRCRHALDKKANDVPRRYVITSCFIFVTGLLESDKTRL